MTGQKILGIVGWKNSGKTTLVEALIKEMSKRGLRLSSVKHAHHAFDIDVPGKDSYRHRQAGPAEVLVVSGQRWALMHELAGQPEPPLEELLAKLSPCDLVVVEGYKRGSHPKIEVARFARDEGLIADQDARVIAVATDDAVLAGGHPHLPLNDIGAIADFVCLRFDLKASKDALADLPEI